MSGGRTVRWSARSRLVLAGQTDRPDFVTPGRCHDRSGRAIVDTDTPDHPTERACHLLGVLAPLIADALNPMRWIRCAHWGQ
jgi:hypothetical protein